jgi:predicted dehydrogenase
MAIKDGPKSARAMRVGFIGAGEVVRTIHLPVLQQVGRASLSWVFDTNLAKAQLLAKMSGTAVACSSLDACPDVDAVLIAIPVGVRSEAWTHVFERGWHVLCEKPVAQTAAEFDQIASRMALAGRSMRPGLMRRFYANTLLARTLVRSRMFGDVLEVWAGEGGRANRTGRAGDWYQLDRNLAGGGILIETGSHLIDQVMFITGATDANLDRYEQAPTGRTMEFKVKVVSTLNVGPRESVPFTCSLSRIDDVCNGIFLRFEKLVLRVDPTPDGTVHICDMGGKSIAPLAAPKEGATNSAQAFHLEWLAFLDSCESAAVGTEQDEHRLTRLAVKLIDDCYAGAAHSRPLLTQAVG